MSALRFNRRKVIFLAQKCLNAVLWILISIVPLWVLLFTDFIIFVPVFAFLVWFFKKYRQNKLRAQWKLSIALFAASIASSGCIGWAMFHSTRRPDRFVITQGYVGWVIVEYKVNGAPALPQEDGRDLYKIPRSGRLQTSSPPEDGMAQDEYFYIGPKGRLELEDTGWGEGGMIWGGSWSDGSIGVGDDKGTKTVHTPPTQTFFVGTEMPVLNQTQSKCKRLLTRSKINQLRTNRCVRPLMISPSTSNQLRPSPATNPTLAARGQAILLLKHEYSCAGLFLLLL